MIESLVYVSKHHFLFRKINMETDLDPNVSYEKP